MKKLLIILGSLLALVFIGLFVAAFFLGSLVTKGVNTYGPRITGTTVTLDSASISPFSGSGTLTKLVVGNPAGWTSEKAFSFAKIHVEVVPSSLTGDHIVVNEVVIDGPEFIFETKIVSSNLQDLLANIQKNTGGASQPTAGTPTTKDGKPLKFEVKSFRLENAKITVIGGGRTVVVSMPPFVLTDLGTSEGGITADQLAGKVIDNVLRNVTQAAAQSAGTLATEAAKAAASQAAEKATGNLQKLLKGR